MQRIKQYVKQHTQRQQQIKLNGACATCNKTHIGQSSHIMTESYIVNNKAGDH